MFFVLSDKYACLDCCLGYLFAFFVEVCTRSGYFLAFFTAVESVGEAEAGLLFGSDGAKQTSCFYFVAFLECMVVVAWRSVVWILVEDSFGLGELHI
jgi:hypothetical protein